MADKIPTASEMSARRSLASAERRLDVEIARAMREARKEGLSAEQTKAYVEARTVDQVARVERRQRIVERKQGEWLKEDFRDETRNMPGRDPSRVEIEDAKRDIKRDLTPVPTIPGTFADVAEQVADFTRKAFTGKSPNVTEPGDIDAAAKSMNSNLPVPERAEVQQQRNPSSSGVNNPVVFPDQTPAKLLGADIGRFTLRAARYRVGVEGAEQTIEELDVPQAACYWIQIDQDSDNGVTGVSYQYGAVFPDTTLITDSSPYYVTQSNVPLAKIESGKVVQLLVGNFVLGQWDINGYVARWAETTGGTCP